MYVNVFSSVWREFIVTKVTQIVIWAHYRHSLRALDSAIYLRFARAATYTAMVGTVL